MFLIPKPSVQSKFRAGTDSPSVKCVGSGQAWVGIDRKMIQLMDRNGAVQDSINIDFDFVDIALTPKGDILLWDLDNKCLKVIHVSADKKDQTLFKLKKESPDVVCWLRGDKIAAAFSGLCHRGRVVIYSTSGKVVKELDEKLFENPFWMAQSKINNDLFVSDDDCKIVALDREYKVRFEYTGQGDGERFFPRGICTDNCGHVLVTDYNGRVHILNKDGKFIQYLLTAEQGLRAPRSIDTDREGNAWVGDEHGEVKVVKYLE